MVRLEKEAEEQSIMREKTTKKNDNKEEQKNEKQTENVNMFTAGLSYEKIDQNKYE